MYYVTDTHAFLWYLSNSPKLSSKARALFDSCDKGKATVIVSAIVLLETIDILDKKKINLNFDEIAFKILQASNFIFSEIDWSLVLKINKTKGPKDLHDRVLISTAQLFGAPLISKDKSIRDFYREIIW